MTMLIDPKRIRTDLGTQMRVTISDDVVKEYAEAMQAGTVLPPLRAFFDEPNDMIILADGFHRLAAHMMVKANDQILVEVALGTVEDAQWESIGANKSHGLRRTNEDKRNAATQALRHPKGVEMSDRQIAEHVGVHHVTVGTVRKEMELTGEIHQSHSRIGRDGRTINTARIGFGKFVPEGATCRDCLYYEDGICTADGVQRLPWEAACEEFGVKVPDPPPRNAPPPDYDNIVFEKCKGDRSKTDTRIHKNRNLKDTINVLLPSNDPQLFAVELRNRWSPEYLTACIVALRQLLTDQDS
ncbi:MAG: hypothetical protein FWD31_07460 [Planctomycetaceae bacterium]|nr:hypothetical protein [Planctomycetaceae bacterium]